MGCIVRHGSETQKQDLLARIASGEIRMRSMAVTEPGTVSNTTKLKTTAVLRGDRYVVSGQTFWTSRLRHSDHMLLLARTTPLSEVKKKSEGISAFLLDLRKVPGKRMTVLPIRNMAKLIAADASWEAGNVCLHTHGGFGFPAEFDIERKFRETRLFEVAPNLTNLIFSHAGEHVLGKPKFY